MEGDNIFSRLWGDARAHLLLVGAGVLILILVVRKGVATGASQVATTVSPPPASADGGQGATNTTGTASTSGTQPYGIPYGSPPPPRPNSLAALLRTLFPGSNANTVGDLTPAQQMQFWQEARANPGIAQQYGIAAPPPRTPAAGFRPTGPVGAYPGSPVVAPRNPTITPQQASAILANQAAYWHPLAVGGRN